MQRFREPSAKSLFLLSLASLTACAETGPTTPPAATSGGGQGGAGEPDSAPPVIVSSSETVGTFPRCGFDGPPPKTVRLDDFESGLAMVGQPGGGHWIRFDDSSRGSLSLDTLGSDESQYLQITAEGFTEWAAVALNFGAALGARQRCAFSAEDFAGIRFRAKGQGRLRLRFSQADQLPSFEGGTCTEGEACYDQPGAWLSLQDEWTLVELPFCGLRVQGWGGRSLRTDPSQLVDLAFVIQSFAQQGEFELSVDDIELYQASEAEVEQGCDIGCPQRSVPEPSNIMPSVTYLDASGPLSLATFEQESTSCGPITRRYLTYVPESLGKDSSAPILIGLHGYGSSGESFRELLTRGSFERIADEEGLIVVYGNGAPSYGSSSEPLATNTGTWRQAENDDLEVDDVQYLRLVLDDLRERDITSGENDIYLTGLSNGGGMTLLAASRAPELFTGIAPFMPFVGERTPPPAPPSPSETLSRMLLVYSVGDPGLPATHDALLADLPSVWGPGLGLLGDDLDAPTETAQPNPISEGADYEGSDPIILATRDSSVLRRDYSSSSSDGRIRVLAIQNGGHFWPNPVQDDQAWILENWGLRNQDFDGAEAVWDFFKSQ